MSTADGPCPFCEIVAGRAPARIVETWPRALAIVPLEPVVDGHLLVIPHTHVEDFTTDPAVSALTMACASDLAASLGGSYNLITSKGREATQSVYHLHLHLVPRTEDDGLALPWYSGRSARRGRQESVRCGVCNRHYRKRADGLVRAHNALRSTELCAGSPKELLP